MTCLSLGTYIACYFMLDQTADGCFSGVMGLDQIPMAIQTGMRGIAVQFDVWGTTRLFASSLEAGWKHAKSFEGNPKPSMANGQAKPAE